MKEKEDMENDQYTIGDRMTDAILELRRLEKRVGHIEDDVCLMKFEVDPLKDEIKLCDRCVMDINEDLRKDDVLYKYDMPKTWNFCWGCHSLCKSGLQFDDTFYCCWCD